MAKPITVEKVASGRKVDFLAYQMSRLVSMQGQVIETLASEGVISTERLQSVFDDLNSRNTPDLLTDKGPAKLQFKDVTPKDATLTRLIVNQAAFVAGCVVLQQKKTAPKITVNFYNDVHVAAATVSGLRGKDFLDGYLEETDYRKVLNVIANAVHIVKYGDITNATTAVVTIGDDSTEYLVQDVNQIYSPVSCYLLKDKVYALDLMKALETFLDGKQLFIVNTKGDITKRSVAITPVDAQILETVDNDNVTTTIPDAVIVEADGIDDVQEIAMGEVAYVKVATDEGPVLVKLSEFPILIYLECIATYYRLLYGSEDKENPMGHMLGTALAGSVKMIRGRLKTLGFDAVFNTDTGEFMYTASSISNKLKQISIPKDHVNYTVAIDKVYNFCDAFVLGLRMPNEHLQLGKPVLNDFFKLRPNTVKVTEADLSFTQKLSIIGTRLKDDIVAQWTNVWNAVGPILFYNAMKGNSEAIKDHFFNNVKYNSVYDSLFLIWKYASVVFFPGSIALSFISIGSQKELYYKVLAILYYHLAIEAKTKDVSAKHVPIINSDFTTVDLYEETAEVTDVGFILTDDGIVHPFIKGESDFNADGGAVVNYLKKVGSLPIYIVFKGKTFYIPLVIPANEVSVTGERADALGEKYVEDHRSLPEKIVKGAASLGNFIQTNMMKTFNLTDTSDYNKALNYLGNQGLTKAVDGLSSLAGIPTETNGGSAGRVGAVITKLVM